MSDPPRGAAPQEGGALGSEALQRLKRGECTLEQYLEERVDRAMRRMGSFLSDEHRSTLREVLLAQAQVDPVIQEYLRRATGREFTPGSE